GLDVSGILVQAAGPRAASTEDRGDGSVSQFFPGAASIGCTGSFRVRSGSVGVVWNSAARSSTDGNDSADIDERGRADVGTQSDIGTARHAASKFCFSGAGLDRRRGAWFP